MDKEAENMDEISSSPAFSINSLTAEITNIPVSGIIDQTAADFDELMHCDDLLYDDEVTCLCSHSAISEESISTYTSPWCSSPDSDISEMIISFDQNVDEEIKKVCHSFLNPDNLETEANDFGEKEAVWTTETRATSRLSIRSEESVRPASCAFSTSTNTAITKAGEKLVSHVIDEAVKTQQSTQAVKTPEPTEPVKTIKDRDAPLQSDLSSSPLGLVKEEQDVTPEETENVVPSPPSTSSFPPVDQVNEIPQSQSQLLAKTAKDFQEEARSSQTCQSRDSHDRVLKALPPRPLEDDGNLADSQEDNETAADWQLALNSSITPLIRRFFQSLRKEQWREVSEGVYNRDVKEQLTDMCTDVLRFILESVAKNVLQAIREGQGSTSGTLTLRGPLYSAPLTEYLGITENKMQRILESSFSKALCDVVGADIPGKISPKFTEAIAGEVIDEVNSVLSVVIQASVDGRYSSISAAVSCLMSKDRAAEKTLEGAITTMKSFLTGRGTAIRRRIQTNKGLNYDSKEEILAGGCKEKRKKSQWKRCFSGLRRKKIQAAPLEHLDDVVGSASADLTSTSTKESEQSSNFFQETPSTTSSNAPVEADLGSPHLEFRNVLSSLSSTSSIPPEYQVTLSKCLEDPPMAEATKEFQEKMSHSLSHQSIHSGDKNEETFVQSSVDQSQPDSECLSNNPVDVVETKTKKSNCVFYFFHNIFSKNEKKEEEEKKASAENQTKGSLLWLRLLQLAK